MRNTILIGVIFLLACSSTIETAPVTDNDLEINVTQNQTVINEPVDDCGGCGINEECRNSTCYCKEDYKTCENKCILEDGCCNNGECSEGEQCQSNRCVFSCDLMSCKDNLFCDEDKERCVCKEDYFFCPKQNNCIKRGACCSNFDCPRDSNCLEYAQSAYICLRGKTKACKYFEFRPKTLSVDTVNVEVKGEEFFYRESATLDIDGEIVTLKVGEPYMLENGFDVVIEKIKEFGGECREEDSEQD